MHMKAIYQVKELTIPIVVVPNEHMKLNKELDHLNIHETVRIIIQVIRPLYTDD